VSPPVVPAERYFRRLRARRRVAGGGRLTTFRRTLALLRDAVVDVTRAVPGADGRPRWQPGFLRLDGVSLPRLRWRRPRLRRPALQALLDTLGPGPAPPAARQARAHVLVLRQAPGSFLAALADWYDVFVVQRFLGLAACRVVLADGHPPAPLDEAWGRLFGDVVPLAALGPGAVRLDTLALAPLACDSPLLAWRSRTLPLAAAFRRFVLEAHGVPVDDGPRRPGPLRVTLASGPPGLLPVLRSLADVEARAVPLPSLPLREALATVAATDVLVGPHGDALAHALFLPPWAGLIELSVDSTAPRARHFRRLAAWRGLFYEARPPRRRADGDGDAVPPAAVVAALRRYAYRPGSRL
jgi:hypothetical protein